MSSDLERPKNENLLFCPTPKLRDRFRVLLKKATTGKQLDPPSDSYPVTVGNQTFGQDSSVLRVRFNASLCLRTFEPTPLPPQKNSISAASWQHHG